MNDFDTDRELVNRKWYYHGIMSLVVPILGLLLFLFGIYILNGILTAPIPIFLFLTFIIILYTISIIRTYSKIPYSIRLIDHVIIITFRNPVTQKLKTIQIEKRNIVKIKRGGSRVIFELNNHETLKLDFVSNQISNNLDIIMPGKIQ